ANFTKSRINVSIGMAGWSRDSPLVKWTITLAFARSCSGPARCNIARLTVRRTLITFDSPESTVSPRKTCVSTASQSSVFLDVMEHLRTLFPEPKNEGTKYLHPKKHRSDMFNQHIPGRRILVQR